jgi:uncharacterized membrane protein YccC
MPTLKKEAGLKNDLVNMRDHLKAARAAIQAGDTPLVAGQKASALLEQEQMQEKSNKMQASSHKKSKFNGEEVRISRDLKERIAKDNAAAAAAIEKSTRNTEVLERFQTDLADISAELERIENTASEKEIEQLRFRYYQSLGRASGILAEQTPFSAQNHNEYECSKRSPLQESMPIVLSIIVAALIMACTMLIVF